MNKNNEAKAKSLQMVEIDHTKFAVELMTGNVSVNLTQMAKKFGKRVARWLELEESKSYLTELALYRKTVTADLLEVRQGGIPGNQGTWAKDRRIAIRFAQWLDPKFSIMVDDLLFKLLTNQAVIVEPIAGVWPLVQNGEVGYPRIEILKQSGYSHTSGSNSSRKRLYPLGHITICRVACYTPKMAHLVHESGKVRQLRLEFFANPKQAAL